MKEIVVDLEREKYSIIITDKFEEFASFIPFVPQTCVVITDHNVSKYYLCEVEKMLKRICPNVLCYSLEPGEDRKSIAAATQIYKFMLQNGVFRKDLIVSLGGGVIGDLAGYVASTYMRGLPFVQFPSSLIAQIDSSIGGKNAVNFFNTKNIIGTFYQPKLVYINYNMLKTLPLIEIKNGLVEIIVHAIIKDENLFQYIEKNVNLIFDMNDNVIEKIVYWNCSIKARIVENDALDQGQRAILNFGHTFGHAIESAYDYRYKHGECVAWGILGSCFLALKLNLIESNVVDRIIHLIDRIQVLKDISGIDKGKVLKYLKYDKKSMLNKLIFILPIKIGEVIQYEIEDFKLIEMALENVIAYANKKFSD